ncbi:MAG: ribonucleoside-diphosphate reductase subunit alpha [Cetobacterium sp.]
MKVVKRNGTSENVIFDKITKRIQMVIEEESFGSPLSSSVDSISIAKKVIEGIYDGVSTVDLDVLASEISATMAASHPDYSRLAGRICVSNLHKETPSLFSEAIKILYSYVNPSNNKHSPLVSKVVYDIVLSNPEIDGWIDNSRDFEYDYFGFKVLEKSYLLRVAQKIIERPQYMLMRVALGIHLDDLEKVKETYDLMSQKYFTHATPTLFNSGTPQPQMSSCFLLQMNDDSIEGIYKTLTDCAKISQHAGGIGLNIHNIRSKGSFIAGTNGTSNGIVPMLRVFNSTARYVDQGGGKRKGSIAVYLEPWHADIMEFLDLKRNTGAEEQRARDLFFGMWIPDLFMKRVENNQDWTLMCPNECEDLSNVYGDEFEKRYEQYEQDGKIRRKVKARELYEKIITSQVETGTPYMLYKDNVNRKNNQKNLGTIKSSNLCTEIVEYSSSRETAVCNLASICLPMFVKDGQFDFVKFGEVVKFVTHNLNRVIDRTFYPLPETRSSNLKHRPIGIGVQGLADTFAKLKISFTSEKARQLNKDIFEMLYFASLEASMEEAKIHGPYETFKGSPLSQGLFQFNLWGVEMENPRWKILRSKILKHGVRNSLLVALMPTASTSQIMGNTDSFEPFNSNLYVRRLLSGEFIMFNKYLVEDLIKNNLWSKSIKNQLMMDNGSVQNLDIPDYMKDVYKTVWEIKMKDIIDMAADRAIFIDQSQSMNLFVEDPSIGKLSSMHMYAWKKGLKTGMYYLRTKSGSAPIKFTVDASQNRKKCDDECLVCSA